MSLALEIAIVALAAVSGLVVVALFLWGAVKDGEDNDRVQAALRPRRVVPQRVRAHRPPARRSYR